MNDLSSPGFGQQLCQFGIDSGILMAADCRSGTGGVAKDGPYDAHV